MRLARYIALAGICSRRQASRLIDEGRVEVNRAPGNHIYQVVPGDEIRIDGVPVPEIAPRVYFAFHKGVGIDSKCIPEDSSSIVHLLPECARVYPVGRLDKDSRGLLLLTNDGALCQRLLHPDYYHEKEYRVSLDKPIDSQFVMRMAQGVDIGKAVTRPCEVEQVEERQFVITLTQGLNRQIRKMARALGYNVVDLQRVRIVNIGLGDLAVNTYRALSPDELSALQLSLSPA